MSIVILLLISLMVPPEIVLQAGSIKLPVYRIFLLLAVVPCMVRLLGAQSGRLNSVDLCIFLYAGWGALAIMKIHGPSEWQFIGMLLLETITPYLITRLFITNQTEFEFFVRCYFWLVIIILPFTIIETLTGQHILRDIARSAMGYGNLIGRPGRMGLERAYGPFEHPIHYGFFCSALLGLLYGLKGGASKILLRWTLILVAVFCSVSSGPLLSFTVQSLLVIWDGSTRWLIKRWHILTGIFIVLFILIDLLSNRSPFHVLVTYGTFRLASAYNRIHIWTFGTASVAEHPLFGIGLNEWERAPWMSASMDNFWLLTAVRYGLPALFFLTAAIVFQLIKLSKSDLSSDQSRLRKGWVITLVAIILGGSTVHFWNSLYSFVFMILGASAWLTQPVETQRLPIPKPKNPAQRSPEPMHQNSDDPTHLNKKEPTYSRYARPKLTDASEATGRYTRQKTNKPSR